MKLYKGQVLALRLSKPVYMRPDDGLLIRAETGSLCTYILTSEGLCFDGILK
jgi:hypothetical protein